jgi:hypothetical protein
VAAPIRSAAAMPARIGRMPGTIPRNPIRSPAPGGLTHARSTQTGTWSDGFSQARTWRSIPACRSRSAASGDSRMWSMRMPLFFCQAPA